MRFTPESILLARIAIGVVFALLAYVLLLRPVMRRVSDDLRSEFSSGLSEFNTEDEWEDDAAGAKRAAPEESVESDRGGSDARPGTGESTSR